MALIRSVVSTTAVGTTGNFTNQDIDGLLAGMAWSGATVTYSFPTLASYYGFYPTAETSYNFQAATAQQQAVARYALGLISQYTNLNLVEVTETATTHGTIRLANSDLPSTSWAYYPSENAVGGDVWLGLSTNTNPIKGSYDFGTILHELGHALGLKHGQTDDGTHGVLPTAHNSVEWSVMTYMSYIGSSGQYYTVAAGSGYQSYMADDIAALQYMYGANFNTNADSTTYSWSPTTGEMFINGVGQGASSANKIFETIWDGNGVDTYDLSNYSTGLTIDLRPGQWSIFSGAQLANLDGTGGHMAHGNVLNADLYNGDTRSLIDNAIGGSGDDYIYGNIGNNVINGGAGNDQIHGFGGNDTLAGGGGADLFFIDGSAGSTIITDFTNNGGGDRIDFTGVTSLHTFAGLMSHTTQVGSNVQIDLGSVQVTLLNANRATFVSSNFIFSVGNNAPTAAIADHTVVADSTTAISSWLTYSDIDGDAAVTYRFWDNGGVAYLSTSLTTHAGTGGNIDVAAANLSGVFVHGGATAGSQTMWVQVFDGHDWSAWTSFALTTTAPSVNHAPSVAIASHSVALGGTLSVAGLVNYADADSDAAVTYRFWDGGTASNTGYFSVAGTAHAASGANIDVAASDLSSVVLHPGAVNGSETMWVQAYDGKAWSAWTSFTLTTTGVPVNHAPTLTSLDHNIAANSTASVSTWLTYADADSDAAVTYRFWVDPGSTYLSTNATAHAAASTNIDVASADLSSVTVHAGTSGTQRIYLQVFDGKDWSSWTSFQLGAVPNHAPTVSAIANQIVANGTTLSVAGLVNYADADSDAAVTYRFWDGGTASNTGYFSVAGTAHAASGANIDVAASDLSSVMLHPGAVNGSETMWVQAYDGKDWSAWTSFTLTTTGVPVNHAPTLGVSNHTVAANSATGIASWLTYADSDSDAAVAYRFWDNGGSAYLSTNATAQAAANLNIEVAASDLASVQVHGGLAGGSQTMFAQVYDGKDWSPWTPFSLTSMPAPVNHAPTVAIANHTLSSNSVASLSPFLTTTDADGDAIVSYNLWDGAGGSSASFILPGGAHAGASQNVTVSASDMGLVELSAASGPATDTLWIQAYDGHDWGAWTSFVVSTVNTPPTVSVANHSVAVNSSTAISSWLSTIDADSDAITTYRFWDGGSGASSGYFSTSDTAHAAAGVNIDVAATNLSSVMVHGGSAAASEVLWVQAYDGHDWSAWTSFSLMTV